MPRRIASVGEEIKNHLGNIFLRELELPAGVLVTITKVQVAPNLIDARVWVSILPKNQEAKVFKLLKQKAKTFQYFLAADFTSYRVPKLIFRTDHSLEYASHIDELIQNLHKEDEQ